MNSNDWNSPRPPEKTNSEKVAEYLEFGSPIRQAFLMDAVDKQARKVLDNKEEVRKVLKNSFINADAWIQAAEDWQKLNS